MFLATVTKILDVNKKFPAGAGNKETKRGLVAQGRFVFDLYEQSVCLRGASFVGSGEYFIHSSILGFDQEIIRRLFGKWNAPGKDDEVCVHGFIDEKFPERNAGFFAEVATASVKISAISDFIFQISEHLVSQLVFERNEKYSGTVLFETVVKQTACDVHEKLLAVHDRPLSSFVGW